QHVGLPYSFLNEFPPLIKRVFQLLIVSEGVTKIAQGPLEFFQVVGPSKCLNKPGGGIQGFLAVLLFWGGSLRFLHLPAQVVNLVPNGVEVIDSSLVLRVFAQSLQHISETFKKSI